MRSEPSTPSVQCNGGTENRAYVQSQSDCHLPMASLPRTTSGLTPINRTNSVINKSNSQNLASNIYTKERQASVLDPMSDRVSTILVWQNLIVSTRGQKKTKFHLPDIKCSKDSVPTSKVLLHNLSGAITGGLWAVMGPSGSGKSTLLNTLACRLDVNTVVQGEMRLNGAQYNNAELKRLSGYVMQDDMLNGYLSVEETLMYTAELRLPREFTYRQRRERVEEVITDLGLSHVRKAIIGLRTKQGISGSERKRLCVGMQLLNRPQLLFLDEPTTGLDSVTALDLLHTLHALAHGRLQDKAVTIVCSIHQPQSKIFNLFDSLILLKNGYTIYQGPRKQAMEVFHSAGFPCPLYTNPADHLLDVITPPRAGESQLSEEQQAAVDAALINAQTPIQIDLKMGENKRIQQMANLPSNPLWIKQIEILFRRNIREQFRKLDVIAISLLQTIIMAVLIGTVFLQIGQSQSSIIRREPVAFFCSINQGVFGALMVINSFPVERALTLRERASGTYFASAYFTAKIIADTLVQLPVPIIFSCIVYFLVGFDLVVSKFFLFVLLIILCSVASTSLALMISAICKTTDMSVTVLPMVLEVSRLFGGFFLAPAYLPKYFAWLDGISYIKYSFIGLALTELQGLRLSCNDVKMIVYNATMSIPGNCTRTGEEIIRRQGYDSLSIGGCIAILFAFIIFCRTWAFIGVRFLKH